MQFLDLHRYTSVPELTQIAKLGAVAILRRQFG